MALTRHVLLIICAFSASSTRYDLIFMRFLSSILYDKLHQCGFLNDTFRCFHFAGEGLVITELFVSFVKGKETDFQVYFSTLSIYTVRLFAN